MQSRTWTNIRRPSASKHFSTFNKHPVYNCNERNCAWYLRCLVLLGKTSISHQATNQMFGSPLRRIAITPFVNVFRFNVDMTVSWPPQIPTTTSFKIRVCEQGTSPATSTFWTELFSLLLELHGQLRSDAMSGGKRMNTLFCTSEVSKGGCPWNGGHRTV